MASPDQNPAGSLDVPKVSRGGSFFRERLPANVGALPTENVFDELELHKTETPEIPEGVGKLNRYLNILPNPRTRVMLVPDPGLVGIDAQLASYVNGNHICGADGTPRYIATQGPNAKTVDHFWRMVWQENTSLVIMATECIEGMRIKCHQYWPEDMGAVNSIVTEPSEIEVTMINSRVIGASTISTLRIDRGGESRQVDHLQFLGWPDQGVPKRLKDVLSVVEIMRQHRNAKPDILPIVHCSAGIGRTGVLIGIDMGLELLKTTGNVDVVDVLMRMRKDRGCMVQTHQQLELIFRCYARLSKAPQKLDAILNAQLGAASSMLTATGLEDELEDDTTEAGDALLPLPSPTPATPLQSSPAPEKQELTPPATPLASVVIAQLTKVEVVKTQQEMMAELGEWFGTLDHDGNGMLSPQEIHDSFNIPEVHDQFIRYLHIVCPDLDDDNDSEITADELIAFADTNGDGKVTPMEFYRAMGLYGASKRNVKSSASPAGPNSDSEYGFSDEDLRENAVQFASPSDAIHHAEVELAVAKAEANAPKDFLHPSQIDTHEGDDDVIPSWRLAEVAAREAEIAEEFHPQRNIGGLKRRASRFHAKKSSMHKARGSAEQLISKLEAAPHDDPAVVLALAEGSFKHYYPGGAGGGGEPFAATAAPLSPTPPPPPPPPPSHAASLPAPPYSDDAADEEQRDLLESSCMLSAVIGDPNDADDDDDEELDLDSIVSAPAANAPPAADHPEPPPSAPEVAKGPEPQPAFKENPENDWGHGKSKIWKALNPQPLAAAEPVQEQRATNTVVIRGQVVSPSSPASPSESEASPPRRGSGDKAASPRRLSFKQKAKKAFGFDLTIDENAETSLSPSTERSPPKSRRKSFKQKAKSAFGFGSSDEENSPSPPAKRRSSFRNLANAVRVSMKIKRKTSVANPHVWKQHNYVIPHWCHECKQLLAGLYQQGHKCEHCHMNCHEHCIKSVHAECEAVPMVAAPDPEDEESDFDEDDLEADMAFFASLDANRAERDAEGEVRRLALVEEHQQKKAIEAAAEAKVIAAIEAQQRIEQLEKDKELVEISKGANERLEELTFNFSWG
jgi:protein tyrosine phosphatase